MCSRSSWAGHSDLNRCGPVVFSLFPLQQDNIQPGSENSWTPSSLLGELSVAHSMSPLLVWHKLFFLFMSIIYSTISSMYS